MCLSDRRAGEEGLSISDVAQARQVSLPSMTVTVKKLEQKGYVKDAQRARRAHRSGALDAAGAQI
jgi:DNA-binding MarR family transcriptional regulator